MAKEGLLKYVKNPKTLQFDIDWKHTKAVFLQMNHIYISPQGFQSAYERSSGNEFNSIRNRIKNILTNLKSPDGKSIFAKVVNREDASLLNLPFDTVGDLILVNEPGFSPVESVTKDSLFLKDSLKGGYKQGVDPSTTDGMWTPFMISGPDIAKGHKIINPIVHVDQYPTIMRALGEKIPSFVQGHILDEIFIKNN